MNLHQWLDEPDTRGRAAELARHLGIKEPNIVQWKTSGVPVHHMAKIAVFSKGVVKIAAMVEHAAGCRVKTALTESA